MSTKTLRKRVALVAVSALTAGLVSVVAVPAANAGAVAAGSYNLTGTAGTTAGVCLNNNTTDVAQIAYPAASQLTVTAATHTDVQSGETITVAVTGPAIITGPTTAASNNSGTLAKVTLASDGKNVVFSLDSTTANNDVANVTIAPNGVGTITVTSTKTVTSTGVKTVLDTITIYSATACETGAYATTYSSVSLQAAGASAATSQDTTDATGAGTVAYNSTAVIRLWLSDKFGAAIDETNGYLSATATGGAGIEWGTGATSIRSSDVKTSSLRDARLTINNGGVKTPVTTTVTISLNGTVIGTKSIKFTGQPSKINVSSVPTAIATSGTGTIKFTVTDSAGNQLAGWTPVAGSTTLDTNLSATGFTGASSATTTQTATLTAGSAAGASKTTIRVKLDDGTYVVSDAINTISSGAMASYTIGFDKAQYVPGEVVTLTITGKDADGYAVADGTALGTSALAVTTTGLTDIDSTALSHTKTSLGGVWTEKYYASTTLGSYGISFKSDVSTTSTAVPSALSATFKVVSGETGVTNADVLKAIVSLIASINKQIAALQKALLRR
jgi:hypothetical protein